MNKQNIGRMYEEENWKRNVGIVFAHGPSDWLILGYVTSNGKVGGFCVDSLPECLKKDHRNGRIPGQRTKTNIS